MPITLEDLRANKAVRDMLWSFDFQVQDDPRMPVWFDTAPLQPFEVVAQKGSGCVYALTGPDRHVLFVTSEGQADIIAASLSECLELVVAFPYWEDILGEANGELDALRQIFADGADELKGEALEYNPEIEELRPLLRSQLKLAGPRDPATSLHHAVTALSQGLIVRAPDGHLSAPLVARFGGV
jgi:hypothetical protein